MNKKKYSTITDDFIYSKNNLYIKSVFDRTFSAFLFILLSPLFLLIISAIVFEEVVTCKKYNPIFVKEKRVSADRPFFLIKFRTYNIPEDAVLEQLNKKPTEFINKQKNTHVGTILKKFYLDELPQLFNILKGEMSFVGPRPYPEKEYNDLLKTGHKSKKLLKGGLCFPVQSLKGKWDKHPDRLDYDEMVVHKYMEKSPLGVLFLDIKIMFNTFIVVLRGGGF